MKSLLNLILFLNICSNLYSQENERLFGISKPRYWFISREEGDKIVLEDKNTGKVYGESHHSSRINFNPSYKQENTGFEIELSQDMAEAYSIFVVYSQESNTEQNLWSLVSEDRKVLLTSTTHRLADFTKDNTYRNYAKNYINPKVKIHYYQHYKDLNKSQDTRTGRREPKENIYQLNIGEKNAALPPEAFSGAFGEILIYDRNLSQREMQQIASYLGVKYGVSLHQNHYKNYYNANGEKIWDYNEHQAFNQNITALAHSSEGSLTQKNSKNSNDEQVVGMEMKGRNGAEIPADYYVFWSDNGKSLQVEKQKESQPKGISRIWNLDYKANKDVELSWYFSPQAIEKKTDNETSQNTGELYYWLVADTSKEGEFNPKTTFYKRLKKTTDATPFILQDFDQLTESETPKYYSIWEAPKMFAHLDIQQGNCQRQELGELQFNIIGGEAPYQIRLKNISGQHPDQIWKETTSKGERTLLLPSGQYRYEIKDALGFTYQQEVFLTDSDIIIPNIEKEYLLNTPLLLNPSKDLPSSNYRYEWYQNGKLVSTQPTYLLSKEGSYELKLFGANACHSSSRFKAYKGVGEIESSKLKIFPNPSTDGRFWVSVIFPKSQSGNLSIYNTAGRLIQQHSFYNVEDYQKEMKLGVSGTYVVVIQTELGTYSSKIIIH